MNMASHVIDDMVLDIAFDADAGLRDDEWRSYLSGKLLPAIESVLDRHVHRDGVLVLPEIELDLGDIPFDGFQEEMTRRIERQLTDVLQHRQAQLASGEKETARQIALVPHARRAIERLADFLTNGVLTSHDDIADAGSHQRLLDQVLNANPAGLHALLRLSAKRKQAVARLTAQFPASALQRLAQAFQSKIDVAALIELQLNRSGKSLPPASGELLRIELWQKAVDAMLDGRDVQNALTGDGAIDVASSGMTTSMARTKNRPTDTAAEIVYEIAPGVALEVAPDASTDRHSNALPQHTHPASLPSESAKNTDAVHAADYHQLLQACKAGDTATFSRLLQEGKGDAIRSVLQNVAGMRQITEKMAETLPPSLLAELIALLQPEAGRFLHALYRGLSDRRSGRSTELQPNGRKILSTQSQTEQRIDPHASDVSDESAWSILEHRLTAALFLPVLDTVRTSASLSVAIRRARQELESTHERSALASIGTVASGIAPKHIEALLPSHISEKMMRLPDAASDVLQKALFDTSGDYASTTSSDRMMDDGQAGSSVAAATRSPATEVKTIAKKNGTDAEAALEQECWKLALTVLLERERLAAENRRDKNNTAASAIELARSFREDAVANAASEVEEHRLSSSSFSRDRVASSHRDMVSDSIATIIQASRRDEHTAHQKQVPFGEENMTVNMPPGRNAPKTGNDIEHAGQTRKNETGIELNDHSGSAASSHKEDKLKEIDFSRREPSLQSASPAGIRQPGNPAHASSTQPSPTQLPASSMPGAETDVGGNMAVPDIAAIVDSLIHIADAWQENGPVTVEAAEPEQNLSTSVETETNLRHRLAKALLTGDAASLETDWSMLRQRWPEMLAQAVRHYMQMTGVRERMSRGFPEAMLSDLLTLLEPQAAMLHSEQQQRLYFLHGEEGIVARRSLWQSAWQQLPSTMQNLDVAAYGNTLAQRTDAILRNAASVTAQEDVPENAALDQAYRRYQHAYDALLGKVTLTSQVAADAEMLEKDFPVLLRQLIRALRLAAPSMEQLAYDERLYAVLLPKAIANRSASPTEAASITDARMNFLDAIFSHARYAADRSAYYRGVLAALLREEVVDLDSLAAQEMNASAHEIGVSGAAASISGTAETANDHRENSSATADETGDPADGNRSRKISTHAATTPGIAANSRQTPDGTPFSHLHRMLSMPDNLNTGELQRLILETAANRPDSLQPIWNALRTKKLPAEGAVFTRETWRSLLIAWMRSRFSVAETASVLSKLDNATNATHNDDERYRVTLLDMLGMRNIHSSDKTANIPMIPTLSEMPAEDLPEQRKEQSAATAWQADALASLLAAAENDANAQQILHRWLNTGLSDHAPALRAVLLATLRDQRMAGLLSATIPETLLAALLASIDTRHALKRFQADWVEDVFLAIDGTASPSRLHAAKWQHLLHGSAMRTSDATHAAHVEHAVDLARHLIDAVGTAHAEALLAAVRQPMPAIPLSDGVPTHTAAPDDTGSDRRMPMASSSSRSVNAASSSTGMDEKNAGSQAIAGSDTQEMEEAAHYRSAQEIHIPNAGMVLATPYIPHLFALLKLTEQGRFVDPKAAERAVHLLQFMVDKRTATPEYQLVLNKLLCGVKTGTPIVAGIDITDHERETIESLLQGIIANWDALGSTSIDGLRTSFLQRPGLLRRQEDGWHLQVERRAYDMLLDRLPWSFSMIRHSWMPTLLRVDWR